MEFKIPLIKNLFLDPHTRERLAVFIANTDRLSMGTECAKFEEEFAAWQGSKRAVLFNSGSSAKNRIFV